MEGEKEHLETNHNLKSETEKIGRKVFFHFSSQRLQKDIVRSSLSWIYFSPRENHVF